MLKLLKIQIKALQRLKNKIVAKILILALNRECNHEKINFKTFN